ncbi:MAG: hypothetical protein QHC67_19070, partial [Sphingobium sp.]|uniref:hypothetical protein n=1 Tax=Sphingobium sp. TaxID=1912891 RepID=UPI0029AF581F
ITAPRKEPLSASPSSFPQGGLQDTVTELPQIWHTSRQRCTDPLQNAVAILQCYRDHLTFHGIELIWGQNRATEDNLTGHHPWNGAVFSDAVRDLNTSEGGMSFE